MAKFYVFYRKPEYSRDAYFLNGSSVDHTHYSKVAEVEVEDLEDLFRRMNVVDGSECELVGRGPGKLPIRSISVGDVVVDETGRGYLCGSAWWEACDASKFR